MYLRIVLILSLSFVLCACPKDEAGTAFEIKDPQEQYDIDKVLIDSYLSTHTIRLDDKNEVVIEKITDDQTQQSILEDKINYKLEEVELTVGDVDYKLNYIKLDAGIHKNPSRYDSLFVSYKVMDFDNNDVIEYFSPVWETPGTIKKSGSFFSLSGPQSIISLFKSGANIENQNGSTTHSGFGYGIVFVPSGLGYFNMSQSNLIPYTPFTMVFKLYEVQHRDHDQDGILTIDEKDKKDESISIDEQDDYFDYDTDSDGISNFLDADDDGDGVLTKYEDINGNMNWNDDDSNENKVPNYLDSADKETTENK